MKTILLLFKTPRLLLSFATLLGATAVVIGATFAFFSDTETSANNTLEAGALDLKIDNESYYNGVFHGDTSWLLDDLTDQLFFDFDDVKPSDFGEDTISLHAQNDYWACANITLTSNDDNTCTEPELQDDLACTEPGLGEGELAEKLNFVFWADDGDNVFEEDENIITEGTGLDVLDDNNIILADSTSNVWDGDGPLLGGLDDEDPITHYIGKAWCFGDLGQAPLPQFGYDGPDDPENDGLDTEGNATPGDGGFTCNGSLLDNATQTDMVLADIQFTAVQARNNPDFVCEGEPPVLISCEANDVQFASGSSDNNNQGLRKDGSSVLANRSIPGAAFGPPETSGADSDAGFPAGSFFSLGFPLSGNTASIVFSFAEPFFPNPGGPDLQVFEVTGGVYPDEKVKVEVSPDGTTWTLAAVSATRDADIELPIPSAQYVRLTDVSDISLFPNDADGYDVDALKAFCTEVPNPQ